MAATVDKDMGMLDGLETLAGLPFFMVERHSKPQSIGQCCGGSVTWLSTREFFDRIVDVALGLRTLGLEPGDRMGLAAESRPDWLVVDLAAQTIGVVVVPVYPTLSAAQTGAILADAGAGVAVASDGVQLRKLAETRGLAPSLSTLIVMTAPDGNLGGALTLDDVAARGRAQIAGGRSVVETYRDRVRQITADSLATLIYTSGTTGEPKGVMLTHANILSNVKAGLEVLLFTGEDVALSFLPLSHAFERAVVYAYLATGVSVAFAERPDTLPRDLLTIRPTVMTGVPRVFEKMHARVLETAGQASPVRRAVFRWAVGVGARWTAQTLDAGARRATEAPPLSWRLADRLVFRKIRNGLGGRVRCLISGSAALLPEIGRFFFGAGLPVIEGYGLTETAPILTVNPLDRLRYGTVGVPLRGVELRLSEDGEILARGPNVMQGYYNRAEATAAVLRDGWFHTGDVGCLDADGFLSITDRKKDLLVTSGGKKIAPQPIENLLKRDPLVAEAVLVGERRRFPAVLLVPDFAALERRMRETGAGSGTPEETVRQPEAIALYQALVDAANQRLALFERVRKFVLLPEAFSIERGELTPTMKVRRKAVEQRWCDLIESMYAESGEAR